MNYDDVKKFLQQRQEINLWYIWIYDFRFDQPRMFLNFKTELKISWAELAYYCFKVM